MGLVIRERRQRQALRLSLPKPQIVPSRDFKTPPLFLSPPSDSFPCIKSLSDLQKVKVLGHGNGGTVYKVLHRKNHSFYALKVLRFDQNINNGILPRQPATLEVEILKRMDSPYIVKCHAVFHKGSDLSLVMEYMGGGSLHDILRQHNRLPEDVICVLAKSVLEGLNYLHGMHIVHRDIKPSNLLVNEKGEVKIADFGVSQFEGYDSNNSDDGGTCAYMSPERVDLERWGGEKADEFGGDVWSLGVVMLECILGHFPFVMPEERLDWATLMCAICFGDKLEMPEKASVEFQSFVKRCLEKDWRKRATVFELLQHPFVNTTKFCKIWLGDYVLIG